MSLPILIEKEEILIENLPIYIIGSHGCSPSTFGLNEEKTKFPDSRYFKVPDNTYIIYFNNNAVLSQAVKNIPFIKNLYDINPELFYYIIKPQNYNINLDKTNENSYRHPDFFKSLPFFSNFNYICNIEIYPPGVMCPHVILDFTDPTVATVATIAQMGYFEGVTNINNIIYDEFGKKLRFVNEQDIYSPYDDLKGKNIYASEFITDLLCKKKSIINGIFFISACRAAYFEPEQKDGNNEGVYININPVERNCGDINYDLSIIDDYKLKYPTSISKLEKIKQIIVRRNFVKGEIDKQIKSIYLQNDKFYTSLYIHNFYIKLYEFITLESGEYNLVVNFNKINIDCRLENQTIKERLNLFDRKFHFLRMNLKLQNINWLNKEFNNQLLYVSLGCLYRMCFHFLQKNEKFPNPDEYKNFVKIINEINMSLDIKIIYQLINTQIKDVHGIELEISEFKNKYLKYKLKYNELKKIIK
jgi:hypothetical protein